MAELFKFLGYFTIISIIIYILFAFIDWNLYWFIDSIGGRIVAIIAFIIALKGAASSL